MFARRFSCLLILSLFCLLSDCFNPFAPALDEGQDLSSVISEQKSPDEVLHNFEIAYTFKDSLIYSDILAESFIFEYFDTNLGPSGSLMTWGRDTDLKTTGKLFRTFDVVDLKFLNTLFTERDGDTEKRFVRFNLNLLGSDINFIVSGTAIFTFQRTDADSKWRLIRWKDETDL
ncbi:MAG: hypothetical protein ACE5IR_14005 [bacterium]